MTDPTDPLAHLYADLEDDFDVELPVRSTSLDELVNATPEPDPIDPHDVAELALLVEGMIEQGMNSDQQNAELGLGEFVPDPDDPAVTHFDLNPLGLAVVRRIAERAGLIPRGAR